MSIAPHPKLIPNKTSFLSVLVLFCLGLAPAFLSGETAEIVTVTGGQIRGRPLPENSGVVFRGIPFAQPPTGDLRWREPQPVKPWTGIREAAVSGPPAAQPKQGWNDAFATASSEDCLYLDVWAPAIKDKTRRPVMVWLHGGANIAGAGGADDLYNGRALIAHDVLLVVVEYRLGIFGFFTHPELTKESQHHSSGNYAALDQIAALQWVHDNIEKFGGDPSNVTLFGQSAGSMDVLALMTSPLTRRLFHRAIAESGALDPSVAQPLATCEEAGRAVTEKLGGPAQKNLAHLRSLKTEEAMKIAWGRPIFSVDQWVFSRNPFEVLNQGQAHPIPLIVGSNAIEFPSNVFFSSEDQAISIIFRDHASAAISLYGLADKAHPQAPDPIYGDTADQIGSDMMRCTAILNGEWHAAKGNSVWEYSFARAIPPRPKVGHSNDLPYVFGNLYAQGGQAGDFQPADRKLSDKIQLYWTNFAKTGNPNGPGLPLWPKFEGKTRSYLNFTGTTEITVSENERGPFCDLYREIMSRPVASK